MNGFQEKVSFIWSVADLLRGDLYEYEPPRSLEAIEGETLDLEEQIQGMLGEVLA